MSEPLAEEVRRRLEDLRPLEFALDDRSAAHAGHAGAKAGAHLHLRLVSVAFAGLSRLQRHRLVQERLADLYRGRVHALSMSLRAPGESDRPPG